LCRATRIYKYLNGILASTEWSESGYFRRMFFRHGRFFILHIFARRHQALLRKPEIELSVGDQSELSRHLLDLAEVIYTVAEARFRRNKGYLSIFQNVTDAQPLSQDVMQKLAQLDAERAAPPVAPTAPAPATPASPTTPPSATT
jgi:hypothetical protein